MNDKKDLTPQHGDSITNIKKQTSQRIKKRYKRLHTTDIVWRYYRSLGVANRHIDQPFPTSKK